MKRIIITALLLCVYTSCFAQIKINSYFGYPVNSAGGVEVLLDFSNLSGKVMKYVTFNVSFYNSVGDLIADEISSKTEFRIEFVGPIGVKFINRSRSGVFRVMYNYQCAKMGINGVDIEYMDGSKECITDMQSIKGYKGIRRNSIDSTIYL